MALRFMFSQFLRLTSEDCSHELRGGGRRANKNSLLSADGPSRALSAALDSSWSHEHEPIGACAAALATVHAELVSCGCDPVYPYGHVHSVSHASDLLWMLQEDAKS